MNRQRHESPAARGPKPQVLLALCAAGVVLFNFPLLMVWDNPVTLFGLPLLPVALFVVWAALIVVLALVSEHAPRRSAGERVLGEEPAEAAAFVNAPDLSNLTGEARDLAAPEGWTGPEPQPPEAGMAGTRPERVRDGRDA